LDKAFGPINSTENISGKKGPKIKIKLIRIRKNIYKSFYINISAELIERLMELKS